MNTGELNRRVTLQHNVTTTTPDGGISSVLVDVATVWAKVEPLSGREFVYARQIAQDIKYRVTVRYNPALILDDMKIVYNSHTLDVQYVIDVDDARRFLEYYCSEVS